jgi:putative ABC transport system permease protein
MDVYIPDQTPVFFAIRTTGDPAVLASAARAALQAVDPEAPVSEVRTMQEVAAESASARRWTVALLAAFAALALLLALVGIYGMLSWSVAQRSREIGIRLALGARAGGVARMIMTHVLKLAALGLGVGFAAALALRRVLSALVFEVSTADPLIYAGVATLMLAAALLAGYVPARRAAKVDPLIALRQD